MHERKVILAVYSRNGNKVQEIKQNRILLSHKKKNVIMPFAAIWMDPEIITLSEACQKKKEKYHMLSLICGI